ncbi:MAG: glycosyltransferase, partial [Nitrospirota bacterium]
NLEFLADAVARFLARHPRAHFLVAGSGPSEAGIERIFERAGLAGRLHRVGILSAAEVADAYAAMDLFAFASHSETQGMVLAEAMAAGVPVVAVDAPGVREVVIDRYNGRLLSVDAPELFSAALGWIARLSVNRRSALREGARMTAARVSLARTADKALNLYHAVLHHGRYVRPIEGSPWLSALQMIGAEWEVWANRAHAVKAALSEAISETARGAETPS